VEYTACGFACDLDLGLRRGREEEEEEEELAAGPGIDLGTLGGNQVMGGGLEKNKGLSGVHASVLGCAEKQQRYRSIYPAVSN
jgi:hypothetical protein